MVDPDAAPGTVWILKRSTDLVTFDEIFRYDGVSESFGPSFNVSIQRPIT